MRKAKRMDDKWTLRLVLFATALVVGSVAWGQEKQRLQYHTSNRPHPLVGLLAPKRLELTPKPPEGLVLPDFKSETPLFSKWPSPMAPNRFLWIALDRTSQQGVYDKLLIDSNADGLLKDESAVAAHSSRPSQSQFGPINVALKGDEGGMTHHLNFDFALQADGPRLHVRSGGWYEGDITVGQNTKHCVLIDQSANGAFNDRSIDLADCDLIQIGKEGDRDICLVGNFIQVDDELYRLEVARDGTHVSLAPAKDVKFGTIRQQEEMSELEPGGENGMLTVKLEKGVGKLPVGKYRVYGWVIERNDENGNLWTAKATSFGNPDVFEFTEGQEISPEAGEPIISTLDFYRRDARCTIRHSWRGKSGEHLRLTRNGYDPPPAQVHIWNADKSYDRTFTFSHG